MNKRMILLMSIAALAMVGCEEEHYKGDDCVANQYECIDEGLLECRYVDLDNRITRWEKINLLEQKRICGEQSCEVCKESFNNCTVGAYRCNADGQLQICTIVNESNNRGYINVEYGCDADCQSCKSAVESRCSINKDKYQCIEYDNQDIVYECTVNNNITPIVDVYKTTSICEEECENCSSPKCLLCLTRENDLCKDEAGTYFDHQSQSCLQFEDVNRNHMQDRFENLELNNKDCRTYSDCDSEKGKADGFCDSFIGYKCSTKCTSDDQCIESETDKDGVEYHYVCRADGRCAPDEFISVWRITSESEHKRINLNFTGHIEVDWGDGKPIETIDSDVDDCSHPYDKDGEYIIRIHGNADFYSLYFGNFGRSGENGIELLKIKSFGPMAFGYESFAYTSSNFEVSKIDIPDATLLKKMNWFFAESSFNDSIGNWDTSNVITMQSMFRTEDADKSRFNQPIGQWDTHNVDEMGYMFKNAVSFNQDITKWNISKVMDVEAMFLGAVSFDQPIGEWITSNVMNMNNMFSGASSFNQDISKWVTSKVSTMKGMFKDAENFNQNIGSWDISNVTDMSDMFKNASAFNQDISQWNTANVTNMNSMFEGAVAFNQNINWNTASVTNLGDMFSGAKAFNGIITNWDTSRVTDMHGMFNNAVTFNQDLNWDVSNVDSFTDMFNGAKGFNKDISNWKLQLLDRGLGVQSVRDMFKDSGLAEENKVCDIVSHWITTYKLPDTFVDAFGVKCSAEPVNPCEQYQFNNNGICEAFKDDDGNGFADQYEAISEKCQSNDQCMPNFSCQSDGQCTKNCEPYQYNNDGTCEDYVDNNGNHMADQFEKGEKHDENCKSNADCPDGFCDSFLGYKCATKCTSNDQCMPDENNYHFICRMDGRCAPDAFITKWRVNENNKTIEFHALSACYIHIDWGDSEVSEVENCTNISHEYANAGEYVVTITNTKDLPLNSWNAKGNSIYNNPLIEVVSFGPVGLGSAAFQYTDLEKISEIDIPDSFNMSDMSWVFANTKFMGNNNSIRKWDTSNVSNMNSMFRYSNQFDGDISQWNTSNVTDMEFMFNDAVVFNRDISNWDTSNVINMGGMFWNAKEFNKSLNWNVGKVLKMGSMFRDAINFNQNISEWNTSNVWEMGGMFWGAASFAQDISKWNVSSLTDARDMFSESGVSHDLACNIISTWKANYPLDGIDFNLSCSE